MILTSPIQALFSNSISHSIIGLLNSHLSSCMHVKQHMEAYYCEVYYLRQEMIMHCKKMQNFHLELSENPDSNPLHTHYTIQLFLNGVDELVIIR
jgi:hypothetical protein